jgi:hypothetical protein
MQPGCCYIPCKLGGAGQWGGAWNGRDPVHAICLPAAAPLAPCRPIGFGIAVFCIAKGNSCKDLYQRFFDALEPMGEPNVPVDRTFVLVGPYYYGLVQQ